MTESAEKSTVDFYFDPTCPFAWITSRWILEVQQVRDITVEFKQMSLYMLNEGRDLDPDYRRHIDESLVPGRATMFVGRTYGSDALADWYTALGTHIHDQGNKDYEAVVREAAEELGHDADAILEATRSDALDEDIRSAQMKAQELVGDDVGTPVVSFDGTAFFGPVMTRIPRGEEAGRVFDGAVALAGFPYFYELKRSRTTAPQFD